MNGTYDIDRARELDDARRLDEWQGVGRPADPAIEDQDIDEVIVKADHATLTDWLTEGCFYPGLPVRHDQNVMTALRQAAVSEREDDAMLLGLAIVRILREQARESLS